MPVPRFSPGWLLTVDHRARNCDRTPRDALDSPDAQAGATVTGVHFFAVAVSIGDAPEREVVTDRTLKA